MSINKTKSSLKDQVKLDYVCLMRDEPYLMAVCDEQGVITVNNIFSGTILYKMNSKKE